MTAASHADLSALHSLLAQDLADRIRGREETVETIDGEGNVTCTKRIVKASAAELAVARALLKDNAITAPPGASGELDDLGKALAERQARRAKPTASELMGLNRA